MSDKLKIEFPAQGWKQFLTSRKEMLDAFDRAREKSRAHEIEVYHGKIAEAEFRKWLLSFLPKRYGVTSGYIVSPGRKENEKTPHFDVIIYDQLESPVLWIEDSPDISSQGRSLAIPVEYVRCVLEIKANLTSTTAGDAIEYLKDLLPLMKGQDELNEKYKIHLAPEFCCGLVFFNLKEQNQYSKKALNKLIAGSELRGFFGGVVLRGEGHKKEVTGKLSIFQSKTPIENFDKKRSLLDVATITESIKITDNLHLGAMLMWSELHFSQFGFDI